MMTAAAIFALIGVIAYFWEGLDHMFRDKDHDQGD